ncbi:uncharacterized protein E0L32_009964 [Thyridium curvatum]|uniref:Uncharacterized protein n=1 Tax=Thyridium curvatum TaxID=1093900 RepID=A0A507AG24_9PEZI|nr:uncharacterized protein E0L32_009964 [Thyridium curvatum]TPX08625.1 hypothetical protein E0L32_009964 [Thyridium curvatum]
MALSPPEDSDRSAKWRGSETSAPPEKKTRQEVAPSPSLQERYDSFATCPAPGNPRYRYALAANGYIFLPSSNEISCFSCGYVLDNISWREIASSLSWDSEHHHWVPCGFFSTRLHCESCGITETNGASWRGHHILKHAPSPPEQQSSKDMQSHTAINADTELVIIITFDSSEKKIGLTSAGLVATTRELPRCTAETVFRQIPQLREAQRHITPAPGQASNLLTCTASITVKMAWTEYEILGRRVDVMNSMMS